MIMCSLLCGMVLLRCRHTIFGANSVRGRIQPSITSLGGRGNKSCWEAHTRLGTCSCPDRTKYRGHKDFFFLLLSSTLPPDGELSALEATLKQHLARFVCVPLHPTMLYGACMQQSASSYFTCSPFQGQDLRSVLSPAPVLQIGLSALFSMRGIPHFLLQEANLAARIWPFW